MTVDDIITIILRKEGGYQKWPEDRGNWLHGQLVGTNMGITAERLAQHRGVSTLTEADMRTLQPAEARAILRRYYYDAFSLASLPDILEPAAFDFVVNSGIAGIKALQRTLRAFGYNCEIDGNVGLQTLRMAYLCLDEVPAEIVLKAYLQERRAFLQRVVDARPEQARFLNGWLSRVDSLERELFA